MQESFTSRGEEVAGGVMSPLLTGEHERWKENLSGENLWTTFLTTSLMGAGFSALELPNVASYAHKNHVLKTQEKKALSSIENETLRAQVFEAMQKPTMAEQSQALAAIDWQAANINQIDAAHIKAEAAKAREVGGLFILGTERHESRRIDSLANTIAVLRESPTALHQGTKQHVHNHPPAF